MMTIDEYMAKAHAALDEAYADALRRGIASLSEHGEPTEEELASLYQLVPTTAGD